MPRELALALDRFGLGARPGDTVGDDPREWVRSQLARFEVRPPSLANQPGTAALVQLYMDYRVEVEELRDVRRAAAASAQMPAAEAASGAASARSRREDPMRDGIEATRRLVRDSYLSAVTARFQSATETSAPFPERLVHFWSNHFAIAADKLATTGLAGDFEFSAIRPHVMGSFADLLTAATFHPAMMVYLDQARSIGPNSQTAVRAARNAKGRMPGLNENLAREIMELHTLGVRTGYSQDDVTEFARALTGWTVAGYGRGRYDRPAASPTGAAEFEAAFHEPGARTVLGRRYPAEGGEQARRILSDLARHPATARHVATKLARHFIADTPPPSAVARLERAFLASGGDLPTIYRALIDAPEAWSAGTTKFRSPWDWLVAAQRATGQARLRGAQAIAGTLDQLGQSVWRPPSPAGWGDVASDWAGPGALMGRVEAAQQIATRIGDRIDARTLVASILPDASPETRAAIARSESPALGLALMLSSPEFLRR